MKHTLKITAILVLLFFFAQVIGLLITNQYIDHKVTGQTGNVTWMQLPLDIERPQVEESSSYIYIFAAIIVGTILVLLLIKTKAFRLWKLWFFMAILVCLTISIGAITNQYIALILAFTLTFVKVYKPNVYIHNMTETLIYGGLASILVPVINMTAMFILLVLISLYDMYAVWHSKHMVKMAKFQSESRMFAGLLIPYKPQSPNKQVSGKSHNSSVSSQKRMKDDTSKKSGIRSAILGGGDIGFPLIFAGVVMKGLMLENTVFIGFMKALIIPVFVSIALLGLLLKSQENKYYPAMPFLSIGCLIGYFAVLLIG